VIGGSAARRARIALAIPLGAAAIAAPGAGCGGDGDGGGGGSAAPGSVEARDFEFVPPDAEVGAGETVTWTNSGETIHNVKGKGFFSEAINPGDSYEHRFAKPGTYRYLCNLHPTTMRGTIEVR
jgi:plastocyanin